MNWEIWKPWYEKIVADFGYDVEEDRKAAKILSELLKDKNTISDQELADVFRGKEAVIFGPAGFRMSELENRVKIAAGSGLSAMLDSGIGPDIVVTDLDGDVEAIIEQNKQGVIVIVHAHGDNICQIERFAPFFEGKIMNTTQVEEVGSARNFGGFTDGDRAVFLALHFDARKVILKGFDFGAPVVKNGVDIDVKKKKLAYAKKLIDYASEYYNKEITY